MWIVNIKGNHHDGGEICVLLETNKHGQQSYGWYGDDKICVHAVHSLYNGNGTDEQVWDFAVKRAHEIAKEKNV